jgi:hypothetical protein
MKARNIIKGRTETKTRNQDSEGSINCFFHGKNKGHITRDCTDAKETQERVKN